MIPQLPTGGGKTKKHQKKLKICFEAPCFTDAERNNKGHASRNQTLAKFSTKPLLRMEESSTKQAIICNRSSALCYQTTGMGSAMPVSTSEHPRAGFPRCHHQQLAHLGPGTNLPAAGKSPFPAQGLGWRFKPAEGIYCEIWRVWAGWKSLRVLRYLCKRLVFGVPSKKLRGFKIQRW